MKFDFIKNRRIYFGISIAVIAIGLVFNLFLGTKLDIQFKGGTIVSYSFTGTIDREDAEKKIGDALGQNVNVQLSNNQVNNTKNLIVTVVDNSELSFDAQNKMTETLTAAYKDQNLTLTKTSTVDAAMGSEFFLKCIVAIILAFIFMIIYIGVRFRKIGGISAGFMSVVSLIHDVLIAYFTFVIFGIPLNDNFIAVALTILGYSINNTIVIYDRIRENRKLMGPKTTTGEVVNISINQSLTRSINTTFAVVLSLGSVTAVALIGGLESILSFALPMLVGVISGCYSSVVIAAPLWVLWKDHKDKKLQTTK